MFRTRQLTGLTKWGCLEIWSRFEDWGDERRNFMTITRGFMSFDRFHEFLNPIHADLKLPVP